MFSVARKVKIVDLDCCACFLDRNEFRTMLSAMSTTEQFRGNVFGWNNCTRVFKHVCVLLRLALFLSHHSLAFP